VHDPAGVLRRAGRDGGTFLSLLYYAGLIDLIVTSTRTGQRRERRHGVPCALPAGGVQPAG
jgi:hypothetical protein